MGHAVKGNESLFPLFHPASDGILICSARAKKELQNIVRTHPSLIFISVLGHSFGGIYGRHLIGSLLDNGNKTICGLRPVNFIISSSPQLGMRIGLSRHTSIVARILRILGRTREELFMEDRGEGCPLLLSLSEPSFRSMIALALFQQRTTYTNSRGDLVNTAGLGASMSLRNQLNDPRYPHIVSTAELSINKKEYNEMAVYSWELKNANNLCTLQWSLVKCNFPEVWSTHHTIFLDRRGQDVLVYMADSFLPE